MPGPDLPSGYRREDHASLPSTNVRALERARAGDPGRLWVTAGEQTEGRGRRGRSWATASGNLAASLLVIDPAPATAAATISFVAGVALHQAAVDLGGPAAAERLRLKWPNDLLLDRRKVAGILVEGEKLKSGSFAVIVGIGVNCTSHPDTGTIYAAGDLASAGLAAGPEALFNRLAVRMAEEIATWNRGEGFGATRSAWLGRALGIGEPIRVNLPEETIEGRFHSLDAQGRLVLARPDGERRTVSAGDVFFGARG